MDGEVSAPDEESAQSQDEVLAALRESESRLRAVFSAIDEGYCLCELVTDASGRPVDYRFLEINPHFEEMTGLTGARGRTALELVPDLEAHWVETYARVALGGEPMRFQQRSDAMGRVFDVFVTAVEPRGRFAIVFTEVTSRVAAEAALRESEGRFRAMADNAPVMVWVTDAQGACTYLNRRWYEFTGQSPEHALGAGWTEAVHPDDRERAALVMAAATEAREPFELDYRLRRHDGEYRWAIDAATPRLGAEGEWLGFIGSVIDITVRKRAEHALRASHDAEHSARRRAELLSDLMAELESLEGVHERAQCLVDLLVPEFADHVALELPLPDRTVAVSSGVLTPQVLGGGATGFQISSISTSLAVAGGCEGRIVATVVEQGRAAFAETDQRLLHDIAERAALVLRAEHLREAEHQVAIRLQRALLPAGLVRHPGVDLAVRYVAAADAMEVGGDWYETFRAADGRFGFAIGDIVGHNLEAAAAMGQVRAGLLALATRRDSPARLLCDLDVFTCRHSLTEFATACCALLDPVTGALTYASAGHLPLAVLPRRGRLRWLEDGRSHPLGIAPVDQRPEAHLMLEPGSLVVGFSDGLVERRLQSVDAGMRRLGRVLDGLRDAEPEEVCSTVIEELRDPPGYEDDTVLLCVRLS